MTAPIPTWDEIDAMAEGDPLKLRDLAWGLARRLAEPGEADELAVELADERILSQRLIAALQVCEHYTRRARPTDAEVHAAQQAAGSWRAESDWLPTPQAAVEPPAHPVTPAVPREGVSGDEGAPVGGAQDIPDEAALAAWASQFVDPALARTVWHSVTEGERDKWRRIVAAAQPHLVAPALRSLAVEFDTQAERCEEQVGVVDAALTAAACWEDASRKTRRRADEIEEAARSFSGTGTPRKVNDHGVRYDEIVEGQWVRLEGDDERAATARVTRMDSQVDGRVGRARVYPEHEQGEPYGALFHADNVTALIDEPPVPAHPPKIRSR